MSGTFNLISFVCFFAGSLPTKNQGVERPEAADVPAVRDHDGHNPPAALPAPAAPAAPKAAAKRGLKRPAAAAAAPAAVPVVADFDHKGCSKCKYKGHGCARCKDFADQQTKGFFWLNGEVVRKVPA